MIRNLLINKDEVIPEEFCSSSKNLRTICIEFVDSLNELPVCKMTNDDLLFRYKNLIHRNQENLKKLCPPNH